MPAAADFDSRRASRPFPQVRVEGRRFAKRDREYGFIAVQHVERDKQRNAKARSLHGGSLSFENAVHAPKVEDAPSPAGADFLKLGLPQLRSGIAEIGADHRNLAQLLIEGHRLKETLDPCVFIGHGDTPRWSRTTLRHIK